MDQRAIIVREDNICNVNIILQLLCRNCALSREMSQTGNFSLQNFFFHGLLNDLNHVFLQTPSWAHTLAIIAIVALVSVVIPVLVRVLRNGKLNSVVAGSDGREVPLELVNLAALVEVLEHHDED